MLRDTKKNTNLPQALRSRALVNARLGLLERNNHRYQVLEMDPSLLRYMRTTLLLPSLGEPFALRGSARMSGRSSVNRVALGPARLRMGAFAHRFGNPRSVPP